MAQNMYAPPKSDLNASATEVDELLPPLMETKPWVRLCSVLGFISCAFILLGALGVMVAGNAMSGALGAAMGGGVALSYVFMAVLYFVPSFYLFKYASAIATANETRDTRDIETALRLQKSFWKFVGIVATIMLVIVFIGIVAAIVIPAMVSA